VEHPTWCSRPGCDATTTSWHASTARIVQDDVLDITYSVAVVVSPLLLAKLSGLVELTQTMPAVDETDQGEDVKFVFAPAGAIKVGRALALAGERALASQEVLPGPLSGSG
jgi:hypothetical protein